MISRSTIYLLNVDINTQDNFVACNVSNRLLNAVTNHRHDSVAEDPDREPSSLQKMFEFEKSFTIFFSSYNSIGGNVNVMINN